MGRVLSYRDAVVLLGGDPPLVAALDRALGGVLSVATGGLSGTVLNVFEAQGRIVRLGRDLTIGLRGRLRGAGRVDRTRRLEAAHAVIAVTAYFQALAGARLPFSVRELRVTRQEQLRVAGGSALAQDFVDTLLTVACPRPAPNLPYESFLYQLGQWYRMLSSQLAGMARELAMWDNLTDAEQTEAERVLGDELCRDAVDRFREMYAKLAGEIPEFAFWIGQIEHQSTRAEVRRALAGVESLLASLSSVETSRQRARGLSDAYRAMLSAPILAEGDTPTGLRLPTLEEGYLDPDFRVRAVAAEDRPADEAWWSDVAVRSDLTEYLVGALISSEATTVPLVVLGQPGAGKSVLTKILAARLPAADFLPVRVVLREVPAEAEIQDQIEFAIRATTGERIEWPDLVRTAGEAMPVVLLDGFDELLQATGVSQSDYLMRVARFQQREADQGRPVVAVVTSRTAVSDRVRYPPGAVALRIEPFRRMQIDNWLDIWNRHNSEYLRARGLAPLPAEVVAQNHALASQPLLLLMLALYDADVNALQRGVDLDSGKALDETTLYEQLLASFAAREIGKSVATLPEHEVAARIEQELQRLSLVAFGMINRRRQWVTQAELDNDLAALFARPSTVSGGFRSPLTQADIVVGRFFFVQRAQAISDGARLQTYEFLHATFGEYLVARLAVQLAAGLLTHRAALTVGPTLIEDDLLYALLSFAPLSSRQLLRFIRGTCAHHVPIAQRRQLAELLITVMIDSVTRTDHRYARYQPTEKVVSSRHGIYSANLVLLILVLADKVTTSELYPRSTDPPGTWHRHALLWRSSLAEGDWTDLALAMSVRHLWNGQIRDLEVRLAVDPLPPPEPIDPYWHYRYPPGHKDRGHILWHRPYWDQIVHKMDIAGGTNDSAIRHAIEPLFRWIGPTVTTFLGEGDQPASSAAHDLVQLWLSSALGGSEDQLATIYHRCIEFMERGPLADTELRRRIMILLISCLQGDAARIPTVAVIEYLRAALRLSADDEQILQLVLNSALTALSANPSGEGSTHLSDIATQSVTAMRRIGPPCGLLAWVTIHGSCVAYREIMDEDPTEFLQQLCLSTIDDTHPQLVSRARAIVATRYPGLNFGCLSLDSDPSEP